MKRSLFPVPALLLPILLTACGLSKDPVRLGQGSLPLAQDAHFVDIATPGGIVTFRVRWRTGGESTVSFRADTPGRLTQAGEASGVMGYLYRAECLDAKCSDLRLNIASPARDDTVSLRIRIFLNAKCELDEASGSETLAWTLNPQSLAIVENETTGRYGLSASTSAFEMRTGVNAGADLEFVETRIFSGTAGAGETRLRRTVTVPNAAPPDWESAGTTVLQAVGTLPNPYALIRCSY